MTTAPTAPADDIVALLGLIEASGAKPIVEGTVEEAREGFRVLAVHLRPPEAAVDGVTTDDLTVAGMPARRYVPDGVTGPLPVVAFFHGGGFVIGDLDTHDPLCRMIAKDCAAIVVSLDYPLAPEHPFPAAADAAAAAVRDIHHRLASLGGDNRLAVAGDSAGGNLAAVAAQACRDLGLVGQLLLYPKTDGVDEYPSMTANGAGYFLDIPTIDWFTARLAGEHPDPDLVADPRVSPLRGDLSALAPAVVVTAGFDPLRDEGEAYAAALAAAGNTVDAVRYDQQIHGFANMDHAAPSAKAAIEDFLARFKPLLQG